MQKIIRYSGQNVILTCDDKCNKAWGVNTRPKIQLDENNENDYCFLADSELGDAPSDPGTYEGFEMCRKPICEKDKGNKWCCRECERSSINYIGNDIDVKDFSKRYYNYTYKN